ncbi:MAG: branched-chain amino acid ABC transporter permease, partial [Devosia sp.]
MTLANLLAQQLVNGLVLGSFYALVALGYTMVFGVVKLLNFAHGDLYMVGAFVGFLAFSAVAGLVGPGWLGVGVSILLSMVAVGFLGVVIERVAYAPMLKAPRLSILITALAVSLVLQNAVLTLTNGQILPFSPKLGFAGINLGGVFINYKQIVLAGTAALLMIGLEL